MRAKFKIIEIVSTEHGEVLKFSAVCGNKNFGPNGESEDNTYARYTPSGSLEMTVTNPDLIGVHKPGDTFYLDFHPTV
jgi:hypothetical protein